VTEDQDFDRYHLDLKPTASRFEEGTPNAPGIFALGAAIDLLLELGVEAIAERVLALTQYLEKGLERRGALLRSPRAPGERSGIVSFVWPSEEPRRTAARLRARGVFVVARRGGVRASPHFYNNEAEIDALVEAL
jgi:selenocysteine lyase/cysteine desulfurase